MSFTLNQQAAVRLKDLVSAGKFTADAWSFSAEDSNAILGDNNWTEFGLWFLGFDATLGQTKAAYAYPFAKGGMVYLDALAAVVKQAGTNGDGTIVELAKSQIAEAKAMAKDKAKAKACDLAMSITCAAIIANGTDAKTPPTFSMEAYTGGAMNLQGWRYPVVVDMSGIEGMDRKRPVLRDHDAEKIVGHTTAVNIVSGKMIASGVISGHGEHVSEIVNASGNGFPWQASIGAKVKANQFVPEGETAKANGREFEGPVNIARRTSLGEISFVAMGADDNTSANIAATAAKGNPMKFSAWCQLGGFDSAKMDEKQHTVLAAAYAGSDNFEEGGDDWKAPVEATAASSESFIQASRRELAEESTRVSKIRDICARANNSKMKVDGKDVSIEATAIANGWNIERTELEVLRAARVPDRKGHEFGINTGAGSEATPKILMASAALATGIPVATAMKGLTDQQKEIASDRRNIAHFSTISSTCALVASMNGLPWHSYKMDDRSIRAAFENDGKIQAADASSTMSLTGITENILNKAMFAAYGAVPSLVPDICYETDTNDFKTFKRYRLTASGEFSLVPESGELKAMGLQDETYANQVETRGAFVGIGRNLLINDDMGALTQVPTILGHRAGISREKRVFTVLATGVNALSFFVSGNNNYFSGAGSALGQAGLTQAVQAFMQQKDVNGDPIMMQPDRLLAPPALKVAAENLFSGAALIVSQLGSTTSKLLESSVNPHAGRYRPLISPFLGTTSPLSGGSDTAWALLGNPSGGMATLQIGYLRGQRVPIIERGEMNFDTLGIGMRCYYDFGVALADFRTGNWNAGV